MQQTPWYRTITRLRVALGTWAVLFVLNLYLVVVDPSYWVQHGLQMLLPILLGLVSAGQLRAALRQRQAARHPAEHPQEPTAT